MGEIRRVLDHTRLRGQLAAAGLYLVAFELLQNAIIERIKGFYGFNADLWRALGIEVEKGHWDEPKREWLAGLGLDGGSDATKISDTDVRKRSIEWLVKMSAIESSDADEIARIVNHRNEIAHELPKVLLEGQVDIEELRWIRQLVNKIEIWWIREVEIPSSPEFDGRDVSDADISPGPVILLDLLISAAQGLGK